MDLNRKYTYRITNSGSADTAKAVCSYLVRMHESFRTAIHEHMAAVTAATNHHSLDPVSSKLDMKMENKSSGLIRWTYVRNSETVVKMFNFALTQLADHGSFVKLFRKFAGPVSPSRNAAIYLSGMSRSQSMIGYDLSALGNLRERLTINIPADSKDKARRESAVDRNPSTSSTSRNRPQPVTRQQMALHCIYILLSVTDWISKGDFVARLKRELHSNNRSFNYEMMWQVLAEVADQRGGIVATARCKQSVFSFSEKAFTDISKLNVDVDKWPLYSNAEKRTARRKIQDMEALLCSQNTDSCPEDGKHDSSRPSDEKKQMTSENETAIFGELSNEVKDKSELPKAPKKVIPLGNYKQMTYAKTMRPLDHGRKETCRQAHVAQVQAHQPPSTTNNNTTNKNSNNTNNNSNNTNNTNNNSNNNGMSKRPIQISQTYEPSKSTTEMTFDVPLQAAVSCPAIRCRATDRQDSTGRPNRPVGNPTTTTTCAQQPSVLPCNGFSSDGDLKSMYGEYLKLYDYIENVSRRYHVFKMRLLCPSQRVETEEQIRSLHRNLITHESYREKRARYEHLYHALKPYCRSLDT